MTSLLGPLPIVQGKFKTLKLVACWQQILPDMTGLLSSPVLYK